MRCVDAESLIGVSDKVTHKDLQAFTYPSDAQLEKSRVRGLYIGNYVFWDSQKQIENAIEQFGYETHSQERTYNTYESIHCFNNASVHDYVKYLKFGYAKVSDHVARDIRLKRITKAQGLALIQKYIEVKPKALEVFLDWVGLSEAEFMSLVEPFRDTSAWEKKEDGSWFCKGSVLENNINMQTGRELDVTDPREYKQTDLLEDQSSFNEYILLGRTYMDKRNYKAVEG